MKSTLQNFLKDENGAVISAELVIVLTVLTIGLVTGLTELRNSLLMELMNVSTSISSLNQSYFIPGVIGRGSYTAPSGYTDPMTFSNQIQQQQQRQPDLQTGTLNASMLFANEIQESKTPFVQNNVYVNNKGE